MQEREVVLCHPVRKAIGTFNGTLKATLATEWALRWFAKRYGARFDPARIGSVVMDNVRFCQLEWRSSIIP